MLDNCRRSFVSFFSDFLTISSKYACLTQRGFYPDSKLLPSHKFLILANRREQATHHFVFSQTLIRCVQAKSGRTFHQFGFGRRRWRCHVCCLRWSWSARTRLCHFCNEAASKICCKVYYTKAISTTSVETQGRRKVNERGLESKDLANVGC